MQLEQEKIVIEKSQAFVEESFGIGDLRVVLGILRDKLYSDPIKALIQEVLSNAKDANVEAGNAHIPLQVTIPNLVTSVFAVEDNGIGISPERMSGIFIQYGASTKRSDVSQSGGFGIGAKSPFAYTDMFQIETTIKINDRFMTNTYIAYIDESQIGKLTLVSSEMDKKDHTGTKIELQVKKEDYDDFENNFFDITKFFKVKPETNELDRTYQDQNFLFENEFIIVRPNHMNTMILVNEIPYRINTRKVDVAGSNYGLFSFVYKCGTDVKVAANREDIDYSQSSIDSVTAKIDYAISTFESNIQAEIDTFQDYKSLVYHVNEKMDERIAKYINKSEKFTFKGKTLKTYMNLHAGESWLVTDACQLVKTGSSMYFPKSNHIVVINDLLFDGREKARLRSVDVEMEAKGKEFIVFTPYKNYSREDKTLAHGYHHSYTDWYLKNYELLEMFGYSYLSTYKPYRAPKGTVSTTRKTAGLKTIGENGSFTSIGVNFEIKKDDTVVWFDFKGNGAVYKGEQISKHELDELLRFIKHWSRSFGDNRHVFLFASSTQLSKIPEFATKGEDYIADLVDKIKADYEINEAFEFKHAKSFDNYISGLNWREDKEQFYNHPFFADFKEYKRLKDTYDDYTFTDTFKNLTGMVATKKFDALVDKVIEIKEKLCYFRMEIIPFDLFEKMLPLI